MKNGPRGLYRRKGSSVYWLAFHYNGKKYNVSTGCRDLKSAEAWADEFRTNIRGGDEETYTSRRNVPTVAEVLRKYCELHLLLKNPKAVQASKYRMATLLKHFGEGTPVMTIRPMMDTYRASRMKIDGVGNATIRRDLVFLKAATKKSYEWKDIKRDPLDGYRLPKADNKRTGFLEDNEFARFLEAADPRIKLVLIMARHTGMRQGEILSLRWENVDLKRKYLFISHSKSGETRYVPMSTVLADGLAQTPEVMRTGFVFTYADKPLNPGGFLKYRYREALHAAGLDTRVGLAKIVFHSLRHTFCSHAAMNGVDSQTLAAVIGNKTLRMVQRYSHLSNAHLKNSVEQAAPKISPKSSVALK